MTNREIVDKYLQSGLINQCIDCQFAKVKDKQFKDDFFQDLVLILLTYDNDKMNNADCNKHMNALISRIIINNLWSNTSPYFKDYFKFQNKTRELTPEDDNIADKDI